MGKLIRFSLGELLAIVALFGLGMAAMVAGMFTASVFLVVSFFVILLWLVAALASSGEPRLFGICSMAGFSLYWLAVFGQHKMSGWEPPLPPRNVLEYLYGRIVTNENRSIPAGLPRSTPMVLSVPADAENEGQPPSSSKQINITPPVPVIVWPPPHTFVASGYVLLALCVGYLAGKIGLAFHRARTSLAPRAPSS
jgi:hypothetical protein